LPPAVRFVGGHPLAGSEKKGVENAHADLFVDRCTVLTPTCGTSDTALDTVANFWLALGARVKTMSPEEHDQALAMTSHLPHLVAAALAGILPADLHELAATGFRDATRIAAGDPAVWTPIFQHNHAAVLAALDQLEVRLRRFRAALESNDVIAIDSLLTQGKRMRDALGS
jgi:prephenate dehydrogenase